MCRRDDLGLTFRFASGCWGIQGLHLAWAPESVGKQTEAVLRTSFSKREPGGPRRLQSLFALR